MELAETRMIIDLGNLATEIARKTRARFFEQSQCIKGEWTRQQKDAVREGNEAVHRGDIVVD